MNAFPVPVSLILALLLTLLSTGCQQGCPTALLPGVLERTGDELVLRDEAAVVHAFEWPAGTGVEETSDGLAVVDQFGTVMAREGDTVRLQGGEGQDNSWAVCGTIDVVPGSSQLQRGMRLEARPWVS